MLHFFRRYQRFFFLIVTVIIVISFSFFGTFGVIERIEPIHESVLVAVDGAPVRRSEIHDMMQFLDTDEELFFASGGQQGSGNYLNDGVISKDFLSTGMADILVEKFQEQLVPDWKESLSREQKVRFYVHPAASFISAEAMWGYFAPNIKESIAQLRNSDFESAKHWFDLHKRLYLAEQEFPSLALKQVLHYQERQYRWVQADPNIDRLDLALFGYHSAEDWFGTKFVHLVSQFIINASKLAELKGYRVTSEEALADLSLRAEQVYQRLSKYVDMGSKGPANLFTEQLRSLGMDRNRAVEVWKRVLLFRRLFDGMGTAMFLDPQMFQQFDSYALETVSGELFQLPPEFRFAQFVDLQRFETYLNAVSKRDGKDLLSLPTQILNVSEVRKIAPQLVQKRYLLDVAEASRNNLKTLVGIKAMWDWQVTDKNWMELANHFNELGMKKANTADERFQVLENLSQATRAKVDEFSRESIVAQHPEWLEEQLQAAPMQRMVVGIHAKGGKFPFLGIEDRTAFITLLDAAPLGNTSSQLERFSGDGHTFYRIRVIDRSKDWETMSFAEAVQGGVLDELLTAALEPFYQKLQQSDGKSFAKPDGTYKPLSEVRERVATEYFQPLWQATEKYLAKKGLDGNQIASQRLLPYMQKVRNDVAKGLDTENLRKTSEPQVDQLPPAANLNEQWKLVRGSAAIGRSDEATALEQHSLFALKPNEYSPVYPHPGGDLRFLLVQGVKHPDSNVISAQQMRKTQEVLANSLKDQLMTRTLNEITDRNSMSLDYLKRPAAYQEPDLGDLRGKTEEG